MTTTMDSLGRTNVGWGNCGFTSAFYAMYDLNKRVAPQIAHAVEAYRVIAEIKTYLNLLRAGGHRQAITDIETFTRSFDGFERFTIGEYIERINEAAAADIAVGELERDGRYGIALPPYVVVDYVGRVWNARARVVETTGSGGSGTGIIGVRERNTRRRMYRGLEHYMYRSAGRIYSWGQVFGSVQAAATSIGTSWEVCCVIPIET